MAQGKTPIFDWEKGDFKTDTQGHVLLVEDAQALEQIVLKIHATPRNTYLIYADLEDPELHHKFGSDVYEIMLQSDLTAEERDSEIIRAVKDALIYDPWINDVTDVKITYATQEGTTQAFATYNLETIFDTITIEGAAING